MITNANIGYLVPLQNDNVIMECINIEFLNHFDGFWNPLLKNLIATRGYHHFCNHFVLQAKKSNIYFTESILISMQRGAVGLLSDNVLACRVGRQNDNQI